jgi:hypothetical protein
VWKGVTPAKSRCCGCSCERLDAESLIAVLECFPDPGLPGAPGEGAGEPKGGVLLALPTLPFYTTQRQPCVEVIVSVLSLNG